MSDRWQLFELYRILHTKGLGPLEPRLHTHADGYKLRLVYVLPTGLAKRSLAAILNSLNGTRPFNWLPTRWPVPTHTLAEWCPMVDASTSWGYGGCLLVGDTLQYFGGRWPPHICEKIVIPIFVLEALAVIMGTLTWGHLFYGRKLITRSDMSGNIFYSLPHSFVTFVIDVNYTLITYSF